ncbi:MAG: ATP-binding protein [Deferrisomatales bacterium]|nr:ATP-binding protein [Deferrisomatales bacterium]
MRRTRPPRFGGLFAAVLVVALALTGWLLWSTLTLRREARERFFEQYNRQQLLLAQQAARTVEEVFGTFRSHLGLVTGLFDGTGVDRAAAGGAAGSLVRIYSNLQGTPIVGLAVLDRQGSAVATVPGDPHPPTPGPWWGEYEAWARRGDPGRLYVSPFLTGPGGHSGGEKTLVVAQGVYGNDGSLLGAAAFTLSFEELARQHVLSLRIGEHGYAWLVDSHEEVVLVDPRGAVSGQTFDEAFLPRWPRLHALLEGTRDGRPDTGWYDFTDPAEPAAAVRKLVGHAPVRVEGRLWTLGVCTPEREVEEMLSSLLRRQEILAGGALAAVLVSTALLSGLLLRWNRALVQEVAARTRDLSEARTRLEDTFDELLSARKLGAVGNLALGLTHEIRNPLSSIRMNVQMIRRKVPTNPQLQEHFGIVEAEILRLNRLLNDLMGIARPRSLRLEAVDPAALMERVLSLVQARLDANGVRIDRRLEGGGPSVVCDPEQIQQALLNLVLNAVEAMERGLGRRVLTVGARRVDATVALSVADTGVGIAPAERNKLFDPFFSTKAGGGGLGLSIVESIVRHHGGHVTVESEPGAGATFTVHLPIDGGGEGSSA